jgi:uncharacterized protein with ParB-like and HNH nuclease domain
MKDAQKPDHVSFNTLVNYLRDGRFVIPDFQREFEWKPWDIRELMRSIFLDYYIGSLLLWKGKTRTKQLFEKCPGGGGPQRFQDGPHTDHTRTSPDRQDISIRNVRLSGGVRGRA